MASSSGVKRARLKNPSNQPIGNLLSTAKQKDKYYETFENRKIISSKYLDWTCFVSCRQMPVIDLLNDLGLKKLVSSKGFWCPEVIKAFYTTVQYSVREKSITAEVRGIKFVLSEERLADILEIPRPNDDFLHFTDNYNSLSSTFYNKAEVYKTITKEVEYSGQEIRVTKMDASNRLLLSVIANIIFNKSGNLSCGSESEYLTMSCILQRIPFNIPYLIMRRMEACARRKSPLPYAAIISKILKALNINPHFHHQDNSVIIDSNSMRRMNFIIIDNRWSRGGENLTMRRARERREAASNIEVDVEDDYENEDSEENTSIPQPVSQSNSDVLNQILMSMGTMNERLMDQAREIAELKEMVRELQRR